MKKIIKAVKKFTKYHVDAWAPFYVVNEHTGKDHYCWTWKDALEWVACYDAKHFGYTAIYGFFGKLIACKGAA